MFKAIITWIAPWLKFWPLALAIGAFGAGCTVTNWYYGAKEGRTEAKQVKVNTQAVTATNALVGREAAVLAPIWKNTLETTKQWSAYEAQNHNIDCQLPADAIRLRALAAAPYPAGSRPSH